MKNIFSECGTAENFDALKAGEISTDTRVVFTFPISEKPAEIKLFLTLYVQGCYAIENVLEKIRVIGRRVNERTNESERKKGERKEI